jgi:hypothetical protein
VPTEGAGTPPATINEPPLPQLDAGMIGVHAPVPDIVAITVTERQAGLTAHVWSVWNAAVAAHVCAVATQVHAHEPLVPVGPTYPFID